jgi:hypothetical protein
LDPIVKRLPIILSAAYWLFVAVFLRMGYQGDVDIYKASPTPINHTPAFDTFACFGLAAVAYAVAAGIWWAVVRFRPKAA